MHAHTKFGIPTLYIIRDMSGDANILKTRPEVKVKVKWPKNGTRHAAITRCTHTPNLGFLSQIIQEICSGRDYSQNKVRGQGQSDQTISIISDTPPSQDAFTHQILNSYLKEYRCYAPDSMPNQKTRSEVKVNDSVTQRWYATLCHPKMHAHTKFGRPTSNNIRHML